MSNTDRKPGFLITMGVDFLPGKVSVDGYLCEPCPPYRQVKSFSCLINEADLPKRLPELFDELRAEAALGRFESLAEQQARLAGQASSGECCTDITSLNSTCTSLGASA